MSFRPLDISFERQRNFLGQKRRLRFEVRVTLGESSLRKGLSTLEYLAEAEIPLLKPVFQLGFAGPKEVVLRNASGKGNAPERQSFFEASGFVLKPFSFLPDDTKASYEEVPFQYKVSSCFLEFESASSILHVLTPSFSGPLGGSVPNIWPRAIARMIPLRVERFFLSVNFYRKHFLGPLFKLAPTLNGSFELEADAAGLRVLLEQDLVRKPNKLPLEETGLPYVLSQAWRKLDISQDLEAKLLESL